MSTMFGLNRLPELFAEDERRVGLCSSCGGIAFVVLPVLGDATTNFVRQRAKHNRGQPVLWVATKRQYAKDPRGSLAYWEVSVDSPKPWDEARCWCGGMILFPNGQEVLLAAYLLGGHDAIVPEMLTERRFRILIRANEVAECAIALAAARPKFGRKIKP